MRAAVYGLSAVAPASGGVHASVTVRATNTGTVAEWVDLCAGYGLTPIAAGRHAPGGALVHSVTSSVGGSHKWYVYYGSSSGCSGEHKTVTIDFANTATISADRVSSGNTAGVKAYTTLSWDAATPGSSIQVVETNDNGTQVNQRVFDQATSGYAGNTQFSAVEAPADGTQWVNDYQARLVNAAGAIVARADFTMTWSGTSCTNDAIDEKALTSSLTISMAAGECIPRGVDTVMVYWSATPPSSGGTIPRLTEVGSCPVGTGPKNIGIRGFSCPITPTKSSGYYESYLIESLNGSQILVACSGVAQLSTNAPPPTPALSVTASNPTPTVGTTITLTAANTTSPAAGEWLSVCGTTGSTNQGAGHRGPSTPLTVSHAETSAAAGKVTYFAWADTSSEGCHGVEASVVVDWQAAPAKGTPSLTITASNPAPTVGTELTLTLTDTSTLSSEWLDYCGPSSAPALDAAGTRGDGGALTTAVTSSAPGVVTYVGRASTAEGCLGAEQTVTVDWQAPPASTTTTTTPPTGTTGTGTGTTTTTVPATTTTAPNIFGNPTTTVPPPTTAPQGPIYYPTVWTSGGGPGATLDAASVRRNAAPIPFDGARPRPENQTSPAEERAR